VADFLFVFQTMNRITSYSIYAKTTAIETLDITSIDIPQSPEPAPATIYARARTPAKARIGNFNFRLVLAILKSMATSQKPKADTKQKDLICSHMNLSVVSIGKAGTRRIWQDQQNRERPSKDVSAHHLSV